MVNCPESKKFICLIVHVYMCLHACMQTQIQMRLHACMHVHLSKHRDLNVLVHTCEERANNTEVARNHTGGEEGIGRRHHQ